MGAEQNVPAVQIGLPTQMLVPTPSLYMNSFKVGYTTSDVFIVLQHNGSDVAVLNTSYTLTKTLGEALVNLIKQLENKTGQTIMTTSTILQATQNLSKEEAQHE
jgi:hypothetical protein